MSSELLAWLATHHEDPVDPTERICDPHHHLWDHPTNRYLVPELHADTGSGHNVETTVFVECMSEYRTDGPDALRPVGETAFVAEAAREAAAAGGARIGGIVAFADMTLGDDVAEVLAAHEAAGDGLFRGIRHATSWDPDPAIHNAHTRPSDGLLRSDAFNRGLNVLAERGHSFDAWMYHPQLDELDEVAARHEDLTIVLDHLGGPLGVGPYAGRREEVMATWRPSMERLAARGNVHVKLGGIGMAIFGLGWHKRPAPPTSEDLAEAWGPTIQWCIEAFGARRCMFESNFPVDRRSCSYTVLWNAFQRIAQHASPTERAELFHDTAARVYRLDTDR